MKFELVINGLDHAWRRELGCNCERCISPRRNANTSLSILGFEQDLLTFHGLVDAGAGVADSLLEIAELRTTPRLDWTFLTHWHPDHVADLARIAVCTQRSRERLHLAPLKPNLWVREGSAVWLERQQPHALRHFQIISSLEYHSKGRLLEAVPLPNTDLQVTPVSLAHSSADLHAPHGEEHLPCCAGFILKTQQHKTALLWDMDATNTWLEQPNYAEQEAFIALQGCDQIFIDCNTWHYSQQANGQPASHASFAMVSRIARALEPRQTFLMHLSGHEDALGNGFGWSDARWQLEANSVWQREGLRGSVHVPWIGQRISLGVATREAVAV